MSKKSIGIICSITFLIVLILTVFYTVQMLKIEQNPSLSESAIAPTANSTIILDLSKTPNSGQAFCQNRPQNADNYTSHSNVFYYRHDLEPLLIRSLALSENNGCHYGLFSIDDKEIALFFANLQTETEAERLIHLLLCYRDYFPFALVGTFSEEASTMLCNIVDVSKYSFENQTLFTSRITLSVTKDFLYELSLQSTDFTLDLTRPMIALTYDDGPSEYTDAIVNAYRNNRAKATFFVLGAQVELWQNTIHNVFNASCEIGNHSNLHEIFSNNTSAIIQKSIEDTNRKLRSLLGIGAATVRPPTGALYDRNQNPLKIGYPIVLWEGDPKDFEENVTTDSLYHNIVSLLKDGTIILMHDTKRVTADVTDRILITIQEKGYQTVTVSELIEFRLGGASLNTVYRGLGNE